MGSGRLSPIRPWDTPIEINKIKSIQ